MRSLADSLKHFHVKSEGRLRQVLEAAVVFKHGYMLEDGIEDDRADSSDVGLSAIRPHLVP